MVNRSVFLGPFEDEDEDEEDEHEDMRLDIDDMTYEVTPQSPFLN